jgi:hypothetical protein
LYMVVVASSLMFCALGVEFGKESVIYLMQQVLSVILFFEH